MSGMELSGRYAKALFELATKNAALPKVEADLAQLMLVAENSSQLGAALNNPVISKSAILGVVTKILQKINAAPLTCNFVSVLVQNGRIKNLAEIVAAFKDLLMHSRGEENAYIVTASKMNDKQVAEVEKTLSKILGSKVKAITAVDEDILGGVIVRIRSKMLDASLANQLDRLTMLNKTAIAGIY